MTRIRQVLDRSNFSQTIIMGGGTVINSLLGLGFYILVARTLSVAGFGLFSYFFGLAVLGADLASFGLGAAIVKFGRPDPRPVFSLALASALIITLVYVALGWAASQFSPGAYVLSALLAGAIVSQYFGLQTFLSLGRYFLYITTLVLGNITRLVLTLLFISTGVFSPESALWVTLGANFISLIVTLFALGILYGSPLTINKIGQAAREVRNFSAWLGSSFALAALGSRLDTPLLYFLGGAEVVGIYSAASKLTSVIPQLSGAVEGVFSPKFSDGSNSPRHFRDYLIISFLVCLGLIVGILVSSSLVPLFFGEKYLSAIPVFNTLLIGLIFFVLTGPFAAKVVYLHGRSNLHLYGSLIQLLLTVSLFLVLVPPFGALGASASFVIVNATLAAYFVVVSLRLDKKWLT